MLAFARIASRKTRARITRFTGLSPAGRNGIEVGGQQEEGRTWAHSAALDYLTAEFAVDMSYGAQRFPLESKITKQAVSNRFQS
jgi:hypothetical protein